MGYLAQLRQFFSDVQWHNALAQRQAEGRSGARPPFDADLQAGAAVLNGEQRLVCEASSYRDIERWIKLSDRFGFEILISGAPDAWRVAQELAEREIPVLLTLDWPKEVDDPRPDETEESEDPEQPQEAEGEPEAATETAEEVEADSTESVAEDSQAEGAADEEDAEQGDDAVWEYEEPYGVRLQRRLDWEEARDCARALHDAGVPFAFGTGTDKPEKLLKRIRTLVEEGFPADVAEAALTRNAAAILGVEQRLGKLEAGFDASFVLWDGDPLADEKAQALWVFVDGFPREFERKEKKAEKGEGPAEGVDASGTWELALESQGEGPDEAVLELTMDEEGAVSGTLRMASPMGGDDVEAPVSGSVSGDELELSMTIEFGEFSIDATMAGTIDGDSLEGETTYTIPGMDESPTSEFQGTRTPERRNR